MSENIYQRNNSPRCNFLLLLAIVLMVTQSTNAEVAFDGSVGTNWFSAPNWLDSATQNDQLPTKDFDARIPSGFAPLINSSSQDAETDNLNVNTLATLNHRKGLLTVYGNMNVSGRNKFSIR